jgi:hypothetical protein
MTLAKERLALGLLILVLPIGTYLLSIRPAFVRVEALHQRITQAHAASPFQSFTPVGREEQAFLDAPDAPWRSRIPVITGDAARLAHVHGVVSDLNATLKAGGVKVVGIRATWDPVEARFTLPAQLAGSTAPGPTTKDTPELKLKGWVLEVEVAGATGDLFKALALVPRVRALLEPVGLRWGQPAGAESQGASGSAQYLILRNVYLNP